MQRMLLVVAVCALALVACGQPAWQAQGEPANQPAELAKPAYAPEVVSAVEQVLGAEAEILLVGDLARNGKLQVLAVNRLPKAAAGGVPGTLVTRAAVIEVAGSKWREVFRCDKHMQNPRGFLGGTPAAPVAAWRLQYEHSEEKGLAMYFTPLAQPAGGHIQTLGVRWNPRVKRYQALDRTFTEFQGEAPAPERIG